jgi:hypothetical protein
MCCVWEGTPVYTSTPAMDIVNAQRQFFKGYPPLHLCTSAPLRLCTYSIPAIYQTHQKSKHPLFRIQERMLLLQALSLTLIIVKYMYLYSTKQARKAHHNHGNTSGCSGTTGSDRGPHLVDYVDHQRQGHTSRADHWAIGAAPSRWCSHLQRLSRYTHQCQD